MNDYPYSNGNLLDTPQKYEKTKFYGLDFLNAYKISRLEKISSLDSTYFSLSNFTDSITINFKEDVDFLLSDFLNHTLILSNNSLNANLVKKNIDLILKKFEVKKKLFIKYNSNFKEITSDYGFLKNYLLLSLLCSIQYEYSLSLKYLNSYLKINDTISSQKINSKDDEILFKYVLEKEVDFITKLCNKKEVSF
jgi:hypothetical protein